MVTLNNNSQSRVTVAVTSAGDTLQIWSGMRMALTVLGAQVRLACDDDQLEVQACTPESAAPLSWSLDISPEGTVPVSLEALVSEARVALNGRW